jgi:serine/threonine-protein kinase
MSEREDPTGARVYCMHCGRTHKAERRRCPATGRALGGDLRLVGQLIDKRYRIVRLLGDSPFGAVYKAEHVTVGRHVALRILPSTLLEDPVVLHRFFREARLMSSLASPRLHALVDAGLSSEGIAYVAYQYLRGRSLAAALAMEAPLAVEKAATILANVLEGLATIHESGYVHRALSPESVLLQPTTMGVENAILSNFGAGALEAESHRADSLGAARDVVSGPRTMIPEPYVAPERLRGAPPARHEDIFSAGVLLAACLSPPGALRFGSALVASGAPPALEAVVARATDPAPAQRFETAIDMRMALLPHAPSFDDEEPSSITATQKNDLRALSRRERVRGTPSARFRLESRGSEPALAMPSVDAELGGAILRALRAAMPSRWEAVTERVAGVEALMDRGSDERISNIMLAAALEEADAVSGTNDRLFCTLVGERAARDELVGAVLARHGPMTPELFFDQVAVDWAGRLSHGVSRAAIVGRGYGRLELRGQREPSLAMCACMSGLLSEALTKFGARRVEVSKTACEAAGDPACIYSATWM